MTNTSEQEYLEEGPYKIGEKGNNKGIYEIKKGALRHLIFNFQF